MTERTDQQGWEEQPSRPRLRPVGVLVALGAVVVLALLTRPGAPDGSDPPRTPDGLPVTSEEPAPAPPTSPGDGVQAGPSWSPITPAPFAPTQESAGAWTGAELLVWDHSDTGRMWRYDPATDTWTPGEQAPAGRAASDFALVWTGQEAVVWGGTDADGRVTAEGMAYDPSSDAWRAIATAPLSARARAGAGWSPAHGGVVVVGGDTGGGSADRLAADGAVYHPGTDGWEALADLGLSPRTEPAVLPQHDGVVVWGGWEGPALATDGIRIDPAGRAAAIPRPEAVFDQQVGVVGMDTGFVVWGRPVDLSLPPGAAWTPDDGWRPLPRLLRQERADPAAALAVRDGHRQLVVWDGLDRTGTDRRADGFVLDVDTGAWGQLPTAPLTARRDPVVVWTGQALLVWGGRSAGVAPTDGAALHIPAPS